MSTSPNNSDDKPTPPSRSTVVLLLGTLADTTWRMFVPIIGLCLLGRYIDHLADSMPWGTVIGLLLGCIISVLLVLRQLKKVNKE